MTWTDPTPKWERLSKLQGQVAEYIRARAGGVVSYHAILHDIWNGDGSSRSDRNMLRMTVGRIRKVMGDDCIRIVADKGYMWRGTIKEVLSNPGPKGMHTRETILSSDSEAFGAMTVCRVVYAPNGKESDFVVQLIQTKGQRAASINLDQVEYRALREFVG